VGPGVERAWLEARFADIAARIEQSLAELRPETALVTIGDRIDGLEDRLAGALQDLATRADLAGLHELEAHIAELGSQIETARGELGRLDGIEGHLAQVLDQLSNRATMESFSAHDPLAGTASASAGLTEDDVRGIIEFATEHAVEQAAQRLSVNRSDTVHATPTGPGFDEETLRALLEGWADRRQLGEEQTIGMLDTVQQALIKLLDRVEVIEQAQSARDELVVEQLAVVRDSIERAEQAPVEAPRASFGTARPAPEAAYEERASFGRGGTRATGYADGRAGAENAWRNERAEEPAPSAYAEPSLGHASAPPFERSDEGERGRRSDDFIAAARRQARQASVDRSQLTPDEPTPEAKGGGLGGLLGRFTGRAAKPATERQAEPAEAGTAGPSANPGKGSGKTFLMLAVAVLVLAGGVLLFLRPGSPPRSLEADAGSPPAVARAAPSAPAAAAQAPSTPAPPDRAAPATPGQTTPRDRPRPGSVAFAPGTDGTFGVADAGSGRVAAAPLGITFDDRDGPATAEEIALAQRRQHLAQMSGQIAARTAVVQSAGGEARATVPTEPASAPAHATPSTPTSPAARVPTATEGARTIGEMPPATIGPSSLRAAAASGDPSAEFEVAARFAQGKGVKQNFDQAAKWYQRAASRGHAPSQYRLGTLFERGLGVAEDPARARVWYKRAAEQGNVRAMHNLGVLAASRVSGTPDYATASHWFAEAAEHGLADSQYNLAVLHESGLGVKRDPAEALKWFTIAALGGDAQAARRRDEAARKVSPAERAEVQALVAQWRAKPTDKLVNDPHAAGEAWKHTSRAAPSSANAAGG
jgi:localization factor PodJL